MSFLAKRLIFLITFNLTLFLILMIGIQNSSNKKEVDFLLEKSVPLPIGFIVGCSFLSGSIVGSFFNIKTVNKKN